MFLMSENETAEYVSVIRDAMKMRFGVMLCRNLDKMSDNVEMRGGDVWIDDCYSNYNYWQVLL